MWGRHFQWYFRNYYIWDSIFSYNIFLPINFWHLRIDTYTLWEVLHLIQWNFVQSWFGTFSFWDTKLFFYHYLIHFFPYSINTGKSKLCTNLITSNMILYTIFYRVILGHKCYYDFCVCNVGLHKFYSKFVKLRLASQCENSFTIYIEVFSKTKIF